MATELGLAVLALIAGCAAQPSTAARHIEESVADAPPEIRDACDLMIRRCSRCHTLDRVLTTRVERPDHWNTYVRKMRLMPGSGIRPDEESTIARCLIYRSFGEVEP